MGTTRLGQIVVLNEAAHYEQPNVGHPHHETARVHLMCVYVLSVRAKCKGLIRVCVVMTVIHLRCELEGGLNLRAWVLI